MIGRIRKSLLGSKDTKEKAQQPADEARDQLKEAVTAKAGAKKALSAMKRAVEQPARRSVLGTILEESFSRVRDDISSIREDQRKQGDEVKALAGAMERLTKQLDKAGESSQDEGLAEDLRAVRKRMDELQTSSEARFNTHIKEMLTQIESVRKDIERHSQAALDEDDIQETFQKLAEKDFAVKEDVDSKLAGVTAEIGKLGKRIQEKEEDIRQHLKQLGESQGKAEASESVGKLFEDLNQLDNEIIDLKRELNKERKVGLDIRKDLDDLFTAVRGLQEMKASLTENANQILQLQRIIGSDFKTKYY